MNLCVSCPIKDKTYECCARHPETDESVRLRLSNRRIVFACPNLSPDGRCTNYESRPDICREYLCWKFAETEL